MSRLNCPNKINKKILFYCQQCKITWLDYPSRIETKKFCSQRCKALASNLLFAVGNKVNKGKKYSVAHRMGISKSLLGRRQPNISLSKQGKNNPNWKGGRSPENKRVRMSADFKEWRRKVFERDNYTCQDCRQRGGELHPDHIKQFAYFPELRFELSNGRTLCRKCHLKTPTWGFNKLPTEQK